MEKPKTSPRDFFLHFGGMVALYISVISLISLWFAIINSSLLDPLEYYYDPYSSGVSLAVASLIVIFPIFWVISRFLYRDENAHPEKRELGVRKWLTFLTLFVSGLVVAIDLITLLYSFLSGGEITAAFFAKVVVILVVIGSVFWYYVKVLRTQGGLPEGTHKRIFFGAATAVVISIVVGFLVMGSPGTQREKRFDEYRISDLQNIQYAIANYWQAKQVLPQTLDELNDPIKGMVVPTDPKTGEAYEYSVLTAARTFELCATFSRESDERSISVRYPTMGGETWAHEAGHVCFTRTIDPDLYPPLKQ